MERINKKLASMMLASALVGAGGYGLMQYMEATRSDEGRNYHAHLENVQLEKRLKGMILERRNEMQGKPKDEKGDAGVYNTIKFDSGIKRAYARMLHRDITELEAQVDALHSDPQVHKAIEYTKTGQFSREQNIYTIAILGMTAGVVGVFLYALILSGSIASQRKDEDYLKKTPMATLKLVRTNKTTRA